MCSAGFTGEDCSRLVCPGTPACSGHGNCTIPAGSATPRCVCSHGFAGASCDACQTHFVGSACDRCEKNYIGYNTDCGVVCVHGDPTEPDGDVCLCHDDRVKGHWTGASCEQCMLGWRAPTCTDCDTDFVGEGHCSIPCIDNHGRYLDQGDNPDPNDTSADSLPSRPAFRCYTIDSNNSMTAWFGYDNRNEHTVYVAASSENVVGGEVDLIRTAAGRGKVPSKFVHGLVMYAMSVRLQPNKTNVWWLLAYSRANMVVNASFSLPGNEQYQCSDSPKLTPEVFEGNYSGYCHCLLGYWGPACQYVCPGGPANPCHGNGVCDRVTGKCQCHANARPDTNCSVCDNGLFGTDCSVAVLDTSASASGSKKYVAGLYGAGHVQTFDGSMYNYHRTGEFVLVDTSVGARVKIHGRFVISATSEAVLCQAVGLAVGSEVFEIHALSSGIMFAYNGVEVSLLELPSLFPEGVAAVRLIESTHLTIEIGESFVVNIYIHDIGVDISVTSAFSVCNVSKGLFSSCSDVPTPTNDFVCRNSTILTDTSLPALNQKNIHEIYGSSWGVLTSDTIFLYIATKNPISGYGLRFNHSHAVSEPLNIFTNPDAALEIKFRLDALTFSCQTVWSYRSNNMSPDIAVTVCDGTVFVDYGEQELRTSISVQALTWYHMTASWSSQLKLLTLVVMKDSVSIASTSVSINTAGSYLFNNGGRLLIGQRSLLMTVIKGYDWNFVGVIDDVRLWKRALTLFNIRQRFSLYRLLEPHMTCHWTFDEGTGTTAIDRVAKIRMTFTSDPWWHPSWVIVDFGYTFLSLDVYNIYSYLHWPSRSPFSSFCHSRIYSSQMNSTCGYLGPSGVFSFYQQCVYNSEVFSTTSAALEVVLALSNVCQYYNGPGVVTWPAKPYCHDFPGRVFPQWEGPTCSDRCFLGDWSSSTMSCVCLDGFIGAECEDACPVSSALTCGGGVCRGKGSCSCSLNTEPSSSCSSCSAGWNGTDCSVAVLSDSATSSDSRVCVLYGFSHVVMFDGQAFDFDTAGEFTLLNVLGTGFYGQIHPCPGNKAVCVKSLWMQTATANLTISIHQTDSSLIMWKNGARVLGRSVHVADFNLTLNQFSPTTVDITMDTSLTINVILQDFLLTLTITSDRSKCAFASGLCGNCDLNRDNDFVSATGAVRMAAVNRTFINTDFAQHWSVASWFSTGFIATGAEVSPTRTPSADGFALRFNGSAAYTASIMGINDSTDLTLELKIRPGDSTQGTVLVYSAASVISIAINNSLLVVWVDGRAYTTTVSVEVNVVQHLSVVISRGQHTVSLFLVSSKMVLQTDVVTITAVLYLGGGRLSIGGSNEANTVYYMGVVDEIRVWTRALMVYEVLQTSVVKVSINYRALLAVWALSEGRGRIAVDAISHLELHLPQSGIFWILSFTTWTLEERITYYSRHTVLPESSGTSCERIRTDNAIKDSCSALGPAMGSFAFRACVGDLGVATTAEVYNYNVAAYIWYCMRVIQPANPPTASICRNKDDPLYHQLCAASCKFGDLDKDGVCHCRYGYWAYDCGNTCPGGASQPCSDRGFCNATTGMCQCQPTFSEVSQCSACREGWSGNDCSIFKPSVPNGGKNDTARNTTIQHCSLFGLTHMVSLNDATFSVREAGEMHVLRRNDIQLDVQVRVTYCDEDTLCTTAVGIKYKNETVVIRSGLTSENFAQVFINGEIVASPNPASISANLTGLTLTWDSSHEYVIRGVGGMLKMKIRTNHRRVTLTVKANSSLCTDVQTCGMCGYNQTDNTTSPFLTWKVQQSISLFSVLFTHSSYGETTVISPASHCLKIQGDGISTEILPDVFPTDQDLSFALLVKVDTNTGVVMSYGQFTLFGLQYDSSLKVFINGTAYDTGLALSLHVWNEVIVIYTAAVFKFDIYIHHEDTIQSGHVTVSSTFVFETQGILTLGGWTAVQGQGSGTLPLITGFTGEVDEFRVWHRAVTYTEVEIAWRSQHLFTTNNVFVHWSMNEGEGTVSVDKVRRYRFSFYTYDWTRLTAEWRVSNLAIAFTQIPASHVFISAELLRQAEAQCSSALFTTLLSSQCGAVHTAFVQFYYAMCLSDIAALGSVSNSLAVVLSLTDYCQYSLDLPTWPGQPLCGLFRDFPRYGGKACSIECLFGTVGTDPDLRTSINDVTQLCLCRRGFWGNTCQVTCPGGVVNTCGGRGECSRDLGTCVCHTGWSGEACSRCSTGWKGGDCSVAVQTTNGNPFCSFTANSHLVTLDGAGVTFSSAGIFRLFEDSSQFLKVHVQAKPCRNFRSCVVQTAVEISGDTILLDSLNTSYVLVNRSPRRLQPEIAVSSTVKLIALDKYTLELQHTSGFKVRVFMREAYLDVHLTLTSSCGSISGLCGRCNPGSALACSSNDHTCLLRALGIANYLATYTSAVSVTIETYLNAWETDFVRSVFSRASLPSVVTGSTSFAVSLTAGGYLVTAPLPGKILISDDLTISVSVQISSKTNLTSCVVWSYAQSHLFAVLIQEGHLALYYNGTIVSTHLAIHVDVWSQVSLVFHRQRDVLVLHYLWMDGGTKVSHLYEVLKVAVDIFPAGGTLAVGTWQTSVIMTTLPLTTTLYCSVQKVSVWIVALTPQEIVTTWQHTSLSTPRGLALGWLLTSGSGFLATDTVHSHRLTISATGALWIHCDLLVYVNAYVAVSFTSSGYASALASCSAYMQFRAIHRACSGLVAAQSYHTSACVRDIISGGGVDWSMAAVLTFTSQCQVLTDSHTWPGQDLCTAFQSRHFPEWFGAQCNQRCVFGRFLNDSSVCVCDEGYWGKACDELCEGGTPVCSGHGQCDQQNGRCKCNTQWTGNSNCSRCTDGFTGLDCSIVEPQQPEQQQEQATCALNQGGYLYMFTGQGITLQQFTSFYLLRVLNFSVQASQVACAPPQSSEPCVASVTVSLYNQTLTVSSPQPRQSEIRVNGQVKAVSRQVSVSTGGCEMTIVKSNPWTYTITVPLFDLLMSVNVGQYLTVTMAIDSKMCCNQYTRGLCGVCSDLCWLTPPTVLPCGMTSTHQPFPAPSQPFTVDSHDDQRTVKDKAGKNTVPADERKDGGTLIRDGTGPGKMITFDDSSGITKLLLHADYLQSIELLVRACSGCQGVVMSYANQRSFTIRLQRDMTLVVAYSATRVDTQLVVFNDTWHLLTLTYDPEMEELSVYLVRSKTDIQRKDMSLPAEALQGGGQLSLGKWVPTPDNNPNREQPRQGFRGDIDELRIWNRYIDNTEVPSHWEVNYIGNETGLVYLWKFDELIESTKKENSYIPDEVRGYPLLLPQPPFPAAKLQFSDAPIPFRPSARSLTVPETQKPTATGRRRRQTQIVVVTDVQQYQACEDVFVNSQFGRSCGNASYSVQKQYLYRCYEALTRTRDLAATQDAIMGYASYCQLVLNLVQWPAQSLCIDEPQVASVTVVQNLCGAPCFFGSKDLVNPNICICSTGYWGATCNKTCPGGAENSCSGFGTCDQSVGTCDCPINREGDDCSLCSDGWIGKDCQVSDTRVLADRSFKAWLQPLGHVLNADGLGFYVNESGIFSVLALSETVLLEGKFIRCFENFTCTTLVSLLIGNSNQGYARITIQAPAFADSKPTVYISDIETALDNEIYFIGVTLSRPSLTEILVVVNPDVNIFISTTGLYLTVGATIPATYITTTSGLLSGSGLTSSGDKLKHQESYHNITNIYCSGVPEQQPLTAKSAVSLLTSLRNVSLIPAYNDTVSLSRFRVQQCNVFIHFNSSSLKQQQESGFSLHMSGSAIYSDFSLPSIAGNTTVEWMVRQLEEKDDRQALFSFTHTKFLLIYLSGNTIHVEASQSRANSSVSTFDTGLSLNLNEWNKVMFTYYQDSGTLSLYHFNSSAWLERRDYVIIPNLFSTQGVMAVGSWQPPYDGERHERIYPFHGEVENLLVWDSVVEPNLVPDVWLMDPRVAGSALTLAWTFDEGQGFVSNDVISSLPVLLPSPPWDTPHWLASDLEYLLRRRSESSLDIVLAAVSTSLPPTSSDECSSFIKRGVCRSSISEATKQDLHFLCRYTQGNVPYSQASLNVILTLSALCNDSLTVSESQLLEICSAKEEWDHLAVCRPDCVFGVTSASATNNGSSDCTCAGGYYGTHCQHVCPGGSNTPCSLHGECLNNGSCKCHYNWAGSPDCSSCSVNYVGPMCSILTLSPLTLPTGKRVAVVTTTADVITFTGLQFSTAGLHGVYKLYEDGGAEVQVLLVTCPYGSCAAGLALIHDGVSITVLPSQTILPDVYVNGSKLLLPANLTLSPTVSMSMTSKNTLTFGLGTIGDVTLKIKESYVEVVITANSSSCSVNKGLLDVCNSLAQSVYGSVTSLSQQNILRQIQSQYTATDGRVLFQISETKATFSAASATGYALSFNGTSAWSGPIRLSQSPLKDFTLTLHVKPASYGGTVIALGSNTTLAMTHGNPLRVHCGGQTMDTGISLVLHDWNQVILTMLASTSRLHVFVYNRRTAVQHTSISHSCPITIVTGSVMSLGEWVPSPDESAREAGLSFKGQIDEVVMWSKPIATAVVYQVYSTDVDVADFRSILSCLLKLNDGIGNVAHDNLLSSNHLLLPPSPWPAPGWTLSDLQLVSSATSMTNAGLTTTSDPRLVKICESFFSSSNVTSQCSLNSLTWFSSLCLRYSGTTGSMTGAFVAMETYVSLCDISGTVTSPITSLCDLNDLPSWIQEECIGCQFGFVSATSFSTSNNSCTCLPGFWGNKCEGYCPGGARNPCSKHGVCSPEGTCWCDKHWMGQNCSSCAPGWGGDDCIISTNLKTASSPDSFNVVGQVLPTAQVVTFDSVTFDLVQTGVFQLLNHTGLHLSLSVRTAPCPTGLFSSHCVDAVVIAVDETRLEVNYRSFSQDKLTLFGTGSELTIYGTLTSGLLTFVHNTHTTMTITATSASLNVTISAINTNLLITVSGSRGVWFMPETTLVRGLLAYCNTELSIQYSSCLDQETAVNICNSSQVISLSSTCNQKLTVVALLNFINFHRYQAPTQHTPQGSLVTEACLRFNNSGMVVRSVTLPPQYFSIEIHTKVFSTSGVLFAFMRDAKNYVVLACSELEVVVFTEGLRVNTGIRITVNVWIQFLLSWNSALRTLEVYLTDHNGVLTYKSIRLQTDVFISGSVMSLGLLPAGLSITGEIGVFQGLVDEVRVWSRPTNPSVVSGTWRINVNDVTPDLHLHWPLNDGSGMAAVERKRRSTMYAADINRPPTWEVSDLKMNFDLKLGGEYGVYRGQSVPDYWFITEPSTNVTEIAVAEKQCDALLGNLTTNPACASLFVADGKSLLQQCKAMFVGTRSTLSGELMALAIAQLCQKTRDLTASPLQSQCNSLQHASDLLPYYGDDCSQLCSFSYTPTSASCLCYQGYWGSSCSQLCPVAGSGVCSLNGLCSSVTGHCSCSPRWLHSTVTTHGYWTRNFTVRVSYACGSCTSGWTGADCSVTVLEVSAVTWRAAVVFNSYLTTWDGASVSIVTPGTYKLFSAKDVNITSLFLPCPRQRLCRYLSSVAILTSDVHLQVAVGIDDISNFTISLTVQGQPQDITFPYSHSWGSISVRWTVKRYLRFTVQDRLVMVIGSCPAGLYLGIKLHRDLFAESTGLLGTPDNNHLNDLLPHATFGASLTAVQISQLQRSNFLLTGSGYVNSLGDSLAGQNLSSCGHMLRMGYHTVAFSHLNVLVMTQQLTLTFWIRIDTITSLARPVLQVTTSLGVVSVSVQQEVIILTWFGGTSATLRPVLVHTWIYLALTWDGSVGTLTSFAIQEGGFNYTTISTLSITGLSFTITDLQLFGPATHSDQEAYEIDLLRVWQSTKSLEAIALDLRTYTSDPDPDPKTSVPDLVLYWGFDEGEGTHTNVTLYGRDGQASEVSGAIVSTAQQPSSIPSVWRPSTVPVLDVAVPQDVFYSPETSTSALACLTALQAPTLQQHCLTLSAFFSLYLEACIREHRRTGQENVTRAVADLYAFYCHTTNTITECQLDGYVDFCQPVPKDKSFPVWVIIVICFSVIILSGTCCFLGVCIYKKKKKKKCERPLSGGSISGLWGGEAETAFGQDRGYNEGLLSQNTGFVNPTYAVPDSGSQPPLSTFHSSSHHQGGARPKTSKVSTDEGTADPKREKRTEKERTKRDKQRLKDEQRKPKSSKVAVDRSSLDRPVSGQHKREFDEKPHLVAWSAEDKRPAVSTMRGNAEKSLVDFPVKTDIPLGFYTSQEDSDVFIYNPEQDSTKGFCTSQEDSDVFIYSPERDSLKGRQGPRGRAGRGGLEGSNVSGHPEHLQRLQSVPTQERIMLDQLEIDEPHPIIFHRDDDDDEDCDDFHLGGRPRVGRPGSGPSRPGTSHDVDVAFDEENDGTVRHGFGPASRHQNNLKE